MGLCSRAVTISSLQLLAHSCVQAARDALPECSPERGGKHGLLPVCSATQVAVAGIQQVLQQGMQLQD